MFTNIIFSDEKEAELFGKKSMKRGYEYKIVEYNKKNSELVVSINVIVDDKTNATVIKTNKIK